MSITTYFADGTLVSVDFQDGTGIELARIASSTYTYNAALGEEVTHFDLAPLANDGTIRLTLDEMHRYAQVVQ
jgi:hypothetical protein